MSACANTGPTTELIHASEQKSGNCGPNDPHPPTRTSSLMKQTEETCLSAKADPRQQHAAEEEFFTDGTGCSQNNHHLRRQAQSQRPQFRMQARSEREAQDERFGAKHSDRSNAGPQQRTKGVSLHRSTKLQPGIGE